MKKYLILLVPLLFLMAQCHKTPMPEPTPKPPTFQSTFSCYINSKFWQAYQPPSGAIITWSPGKLLVLYDSSLSDGSLWIQAVRDTLGVKESLTISTKYGSGQSTVGKYKASTIDASLKDCSMQNDTVPNWDNWIEISSVDTIKRVITGKFGGKPIFSTCSNGTITNGSFEVKY